MKKSVAYKILGTGLLASALIGCGGSAQKSETKVTNGRAIAESSYPSVVLLVMQTDEGQGICTGTFVNDSQIVSAGHCVDGLDSEDPAIYLVTINAEGQYVATAKAVSFAQHPNYSIRLGVSPYDVSVINFEDDTAPAVSSLATRAPSAGDALTIVGYGNNVNEFDRWGNLTGSGAGTKRVGTNEVGSVSGGFINFLGLPEADGETDEGTLVSSGSGDSGGPLFVSGKLAGITSGGGLRSDGRGGYVATSKYVDINSRYVKSFFESELKD
ncbi:trypsin-like serine protease [Oligoflexus tunisiensis]|uniref:trypsin-like serine protease n=1 Tax=Oligoflexus tunisiensis TaxID=708132 RepID=UPI00114CA2FF|nr:trypsin-like serine protease [Oligoflexus tunisiensis]